MNQGNSMSESMRAAFEAKFPVPAGVRYWEGQEKYVADEPADIGVPYLAIVQNYRWEVWQSALSQQGEAVAPMCVVFDGPPGPDGPRFVEVEDGNGNSIDAGEWMKRDDGLWELRLIAHMPAPKPQGEPVAYLHCLHTFDGPPLEELSFEDDVSACFDEGDAERVSVTPLVPAPAADELASLREQVKGLEAQLASLRALYQEVSNDGR